MTALGADRAARGLLIAAYATAALAVVGALWADAGDAPEHWVRAQRASPAAAAALVAALLAARGAWHRRATRSAWVPLAGAALTACAAGLGALTGAI